MSNCQAILDVSQEEHEVICGDRGSRFEFRFPAATTSFDVITRNVAFIYYARDFINAKISKGLMMGTELEDTFGTSESIGQELIAYIRKQRPSRKRDLVLGAIDAS